MIHAQADQLELGRMIGTVTTAMQEGSSIKIRWPVHATDANGVELAARHCYRGRHYSGGLVAWVNLPHIEGYYRDYRTPHTLERRFKPGYTWAQVIYWLRLMYKEAYTRWYTIEEALAYQHALELRIDALTPLFRERFMAWGEVASAEGRQDCYTLMTAEDYAYWHQICGQIEHEQGKALYTNTQEV